MPLFENVRAFLYSSSCYKITVRLILAVSHYQKYQKAEHSYIWKQNKKYLFTVEHLHLQMWRGINGVLWVNNVNIYQKSFLIMYFTVSEYFLTGNFCVLYSKALPLNICSSNVTISSTSKRSQTFWQKFHLIY